MPDRYCPMFCHRMMSDAACDSESVLSCFGRLTTTKNATYNAYLDPFTQV